MRLSVEFLILLTLGVSSVILGVFTTFKQLGGTYGLINLPVANLFGWHLRNPRDWLLPLAILWLAAHAFLLGLILSLKFLSAKLLVLLALAGTVLWFAVKRAPRYMRRPHAA